jgi:acetyl-CoA synthetase
VIDELRGRVVEMYVALKPGIARSQEIEPRWPRQSRPDREDRPAEERRIVLDMPKTRSGKIMRRVIAGISNFADVGDTTTCSSRSVLLPSNARVRPVSCVVPTITMDASTSSARSAKPCAADVEATLR